MNHTSEIRAIIFDLGDTLIYFDGDWNQTLLRAIKKLWSSLKNLGYNLDPDLFIRDFSSRMREYYKERDKTYVEHTSAKVLYDSLKTAGFAEPQMEDIHSALKEMYSITQAQWKIEPDAIETLHWIKEHGYHVGLISNASDSDDVYTLLHQTGIIDFFEIILVSAEFGCRKPHQTIFQHALDFFSIHPQNCVMVGDKLAMDISGAKSLGMKAVWKSNRSQSEERLLLEEFKPDLEISNLTELKSFLVSFQ